MCVCVCVCVLAWVKNFTVFGDVQVYGMYIASPKIKPRTIPDLVIDITVVGAVTRYAIFTPCVILKLHK